MSDVLQRDEPTIDAVVPDPPGSSGPSRWRRAWQFGPVRLLAVFWVVLVVGAAILAPILPLPDPNGGGHGVSLPPSAAHWLGTDSLGRDELSRIVFGGRTSLVIACLSVAIALLIGVGLGLASGYFRGATDFTASVLTDVVLSFPGLILLTIVSALAGSSTRNLVIAIALIRIPAFVRLSRASALSYSQREFVSAARGSGARDIRIALREVLPNVFPAVRAYTFAALGQVFVMEGSLSFLGFGVQPPTADWGGMIAQGRPLLVTSPHLVLIPGITLFLTVLALNAVAERDGRGGRGLALR